MIRMAQVEVDNGAHTAAQTLQGGSGPQSRLVQQLDHFAESLFADGKQQLFLVFIMAVDSHGGTADFRSYPAHGNALITFAGKEIARGIADLITQWRMRAADFGSSYGCGTFVDQRHERPPSRCLHCIQELPRSQVEEAGMHQLAEDRQKEAPVRRPQTLIYMMS